jgi:hypothetical protein
MLLDLSFLVFTISCLWILTKGISNYQIPTRNFLVSIGLWIALLTIASVSGFLYDFSVFPPYRMLMVLLVPMVVLLRYTLSSKFDRVVNQMPASWIVKMQGFRVVVELFLWWAFLEEVIPEQMTFEGRNFDILAGLTAPLVAYGWLRAGKEKPAWVLVWNFVGLLLLFNILIIAVLSMPTPMRYFLNDPPNTVVATFPWVLLPGILVALAFGLHLISIRQMLTMMKTRTQPKHG